MRDFIENHLLRNLYEHWVASRSSRVIPFRSSLDLAKIPEVFSNLIIFEFLPPEETYICRLAGDTIQKTYKKNPAGQKLETVFETEFAAVLGSYLDTVRTHRSVAVGHATNRMEHNVEILLLPLGNAEGEIVQILCVQVCSYDVEQFGFEFTPDQFEFQTMECRDLPD